MAADIPALTVLMDAAISELQRAFLELSPIVFNVDNLAGCVDPFKRVRPYAANTLLFTHESMAFPKPRAQVRFLPGHCRWRRHLLAAPQFVAMVGHWARNLGRWADDSKWAGQVSIRISSVKNGALYHLSYRPL